MLVAITLHFRNSTFVIAVVWSYTSCLRVTVVWVIARCNTSDKPSSVNFNIVSSWISVWPCVFTVTVIFWCLRPRHQRVDRWNANLRFLIEGAQFFSTVHDLLINLQVVILETIILRVGSQCEANTRKKCQREQNSFFIPHTFKHSTKTYLQITHLDTLMGT